MIGKYVLGILVFVCASADIALAQAPPTALEIVTAADKVRNPAKPFRVSLPAISRHLRVLEKARLVERRRPGRTQLIRIRSSGLQPARDWMAQFAAALDFSFDKLDNLLEKELRKASR